MVQFSPFRSHQTFTPEFVRRIVLQRQYKLADVVNSGLCRRYDANVLSGRNRIGRVSRAVNKIPPVDWISAGKRASSLLSSDMQHGERQKRTSEVAELLGIQRQTLRNLLAAYNFLIVVQNVDEVAYTALSRLPSAAVEVYSRWFARDHASALNHAKSAAHLGLSVREIMAAEKSARGPSYQQLSGARSFLNERRNLGQTYLTERNDIAEHWDAIGIEVPKVRDLRVAQCEDPIGRAFGVGELLTASNVTGLSKVKIGPNVPWPHLVGIVEVGKRALAEGYRKEAKSSLTRAAAASLLYPLVLVLLPDADSMIAFNDGLPTLDHFSISPAKSKMQSAIELSGQLYVFAPQSGGVIFAPADRLSAIL